jgi:hypothetical protein
MESMMEKSGAEAVTGDKVQKFYDEAIKGLPPEEEAKPATSWCPPRTRPRRRVARLKAGEDFAKVAGEVSKDPGSGKEGGDLGWFTKDRMVKEFAEAAFALKAGEISAPVKSQFGWHVIKLEEKRTKPPAAERREGRIVALPGAEGPAGHDPEAALGSQDRAGRACRSARQARRTAEEAIRGLAMAKTAVPVSPLAPKKQPKLPALDGVVFATAEAGIRYKGRTDVLLVSMPRERRWPACSPEIEMPLGPGGLVPRQPRRRQGAGAGGQFRQCQRLHRHQGPRSGGADRRDRCQGTGRRGVRDFPRLDRGDRRTAGRERSSTA